VGHATRNEHTAKEEEGVVGLMIVSGHSESWGILLF